MQERGTIMKQDRRSTKLSAAQKKKLIIIIAAAVVLITAAVVILRKSVSEKYGKKDDTEILSAEVTRGSISTSVSGSGQLSDDDVETLDIPDGVELEEIKAVRGSKVEEGDLLATVDLNTVMLAMSTVSDELDTLDDEINSAVSDSVSSYISSSVSGRVKKIYAAAGDSVNDVMYEHGALMLVSLDGYMAVDIDTAALSVGDSMTVSTSDGTEDTGTVGAVLDGTATVLITDNGPAYGDTVSVKSASGADLGSGELYTHDELKIVGYAGTVSYLSVSEGSSIYSGSTLLGLTDMDYTANYETLLSERSDKEAVLNRLIKIYKEGALYSDISGTIKEINADDDESRTDDSSTEGQYFSISPDKTMSIPVSVDESEILSVSVGQSAIVSIDSINGEIFNGTVTEIDRAGTSSSGVTTYTATISIGKTDAMLAGMSASATIVIDGVDDALLIPVDALNKTSSSYYVYTSYDESSGEFGGMVEVTVGISNANYVEITGGLNEGDTVYYKEQQTTSGFMPGGMDFGGGSMPGGDFGGGMPSGDFGGGNMPSGGPGGAPGGRN